MGGSRYPRGSGLPEFPTTVILPGKYLETCSLTGGGRLQVFEHRNRGSIVGTPAVLESKHVLAFVIIGITVCSLLCCLC